MFIFASTVACFITLSGFWKREGTYREQADVTFRRELVISLAGYKQSSRISFSSFSHLNHLLSDQLRVPLIRVRHDGMLEDATVSCIVSWPDWISEITKLTLLFYWKQLMGLFSRLVAHMGVLTYVGWLFLTGYLFRVRNCVSLMNNPRADLSCHWRSYQYIMGRTFCVWHLHFIRRVIPRSQ